MIIDNTYFIGSLYIPHANPSISDDVEAVESDVTEFINDYTREALIKCLGYQLFKELEDELDPTQANGLDSGAAAKWNDLLNGKEYTDPSSSLTVYWRGIRYKSISTGDYNRSFLANYVYFYYEQDDYVTRSDVGHAIEVAKNAEIVAPTNKVVKAWRTFVKLVQGEETIPQSYDKLGMFGVDWYSQGGAEVSLYKFINDSNQIVEDTYAEFTPKVWNNINQFGI